MAILRDQSLAEVSTQSPLVREVKEAPCGS
jgi:hypothetical protein